MLPKIKHRKIFNTLLAMMLLQAMTFIGHANESGTNQYQSQEAYKSIYSRMEAYRNFNLALVLIVTLLVIAAIVIRIYTDKEITVRKIAQRRVHTINKAKYDEEEEQIREREKQLEAEKQERRAQRLSQDVFGQTEFSRAFSIDEPEEEEDFFGQPEFEWECPIINQEYTNEIEQTEQIEQTDEIQEQGQSQVQGQISQDSTDDASTKAELDSYQPKINEELIDGISVDYDKIQVIQRDKTKETRKDMNNTEKKEIQIR